MRNFLFGLIIIVLMGFIAYTTVGTCENVPEIRKKAPFQMAERGWKIMRYEGYKYGSWDVHGGTVWYHVCNIDNPEIQYRVHISMWKGELQWYYGAPEKLIRAQIER